MKSNCTQYNQLSNVGYMKKNSSPKKFPKIIWHKVIKKMKDTLTWEGMRVWGSSLQALGTHDMHRVVKARPFLQKNI